MEQYYLRLKLYVEDSFNEIFQVILDSCAILISKLKTHLPTFNQDCMIAVEFLMYNTRRGQLIEYVANLPSQDRFGSLNR
ncbi:unnamed protein product [Moneuplotes crassus]|uniref:Uncharacterized protein n=1 Tax=Euplotes crassus TaxID=5936 RepID=A0AAD1XTV2_EUPCR|nr:unnamed protein product [Moneuplotes crassus]